MVKKSVSHRTRRKFYINLYTFVLYLIAAGTGLLLQLKYHLHRLPADCAVMGLNKPGWLVLHQVSAIAALAGIVFHFVQHWKFLSVITGKIIDLKSISPAGLSYWLFIFCIPAYLTAMASWLLTGNKDPGGFLLIEIHDKLALLLIIPSTIHIILRSGWMFRTYRQLKKGAR